MLRWPLARTQSCYVQVGRQTPMQVPMYASLDMYKLALNLPQDCAKLNDPFKICKTVLLVKDQPFLNTDGSSLILSDRLYCARGAKG